MLIYQRVLCFVEHGNQHAINMESSVVNTKISASAVRWTAFSLARPLDQFQQAINRKFEDMHTILHILPWCAIITGYRH